MTKEDRRACAKERVGFHQRFAPFFGRIEGQGHAFHYLQGLLLAPDRKSIEPMGLQFADGNVIPPCRSRGQPPSRPRRDSVRSVREVAASPPLSAWQTLPLRDGAKGP